MNWVTARLCWPPTIHSRSPPAPLVLAAVWLVLPWQRVAGMRLHVQRLVFSSQRATGEPEVAQSTRSRTQPRGLRLGTLQLCLTLMGLPSPGTTQQRDGHRLDHLVWLLVFHRRSFWLFFCHPFFSRKRFFSGTKLGFSLILCTSMETSGSVVSTGNEEQSFHVRYR